MRYVDAGNHDIAVRTRIVGTPSRSASSTSSSPHETDGRRGYTLEVAYNQRDRAIERQAAIDRVRRGYYTDNREDALIMWRDPLPVSSVGTP